MDWFHGGLNFHIEHHLYPNMPRHNFRSASEYVRRVCSEVGVTYDERSFWQAVYDTVANFKHVASKIGLDNLSDLKKE